MQVSILSIALVFAAGVLADIFPAPCTYTPVAGRPCCIPDCAPPTPIHVPGIPQDLCDFPGFPDCSKLPPGTGTSGGHPGWDSATGVYSGSTGGRQKWDPAHPGPAHLDHGGNDNDEADGVVPPIQRKSLGVTNLPRRWIREFMGRVK